MPDFLKGKGVLYSYLAMYITYLECTQPKDHSYCSLFKNRHTLDDLFVRTKYEQDVLSIQVIKLYI